MPSPSGRPSATGSTTGVLGLAVRALATAEVVADRVGRTRRKVIPSPRAPREDDVARTVRRAARADDAALAGHRGERVLPRGQER